MPNLKGTMLNTPDLTMAHSMTTQWQMQFTVSDSVPGRRCDKRCSSTSKWTTIELADTAPTAISARKRLRHNKLLNGVSTVGGQDHIDSAHERLLETAEAMKEELTAKIGSESSSWRNCHEPDSSFSKLGACNGVRVEYVKIMPFSAAC